MPEAAKKEEISPTLWEESGFLLTEKTEPMVYITERGIEYPVKLLPMKKADDAVLVPFFEVLARAGVVVVPANKANGEEYAFAIGDDFYFFSYDFNEEKIPSNITISKNGELMIMSDRMATLLDGMVYLPLADMEKITGVTFVLNEETLMYRVTLPTEAAEETEPIEAEET